MNMTPDNSACPHSTEKLDPITLALFQNRLDYVAKQMGWVMTLVEDWAACGNSAITVATDLRAVRHVR